MIGEKLIAAGVITEEQLQEALKAQEGSDKRLGDVIIELGLATKEQVEAAFNS